MISKDLNESQRFDDNEESKLNRTMTDVRDFSKSLKNTMKTSRQEKASLNYSKTNEINDHQSFIFNDNQGDIKLLYEQLEK